MQKRTPTRHRAAVTGSSRSPPEHATMARPSAIAALLLLVLSLLAVVHCRTVAVEADHAAEPESTAAVAVSDENGLSNPTLPAEAGASATEEEEVLPVEQQHGFEFLRLPSHRLHRHRPCSLHHHLGGKRHHGAFPDAPRRFHDHYAGHGERREAVSHLAVLPAEEAREEAEEVKPVAEPDPDRSLPESDGERDLSFADARHDDERAAAVRAWKKEMLRRWFHFHHGMPRHRLHHVHHDEEGQELEEEEDAAPEGMNMKRFHFHHHHDEEDEEKNMMRKRPRHAEHDEDSGDEDEQVEEMVRQFRKAIMRRRFGHGHGHGRRFSHHDHRHRHAEKAEKQARGDEQSGVMAWIRGFMNQF